METKTAAAGSGLGLPGWAKLVLIVVVFIVLIVIIVIILKKIFSGKDASSKEDVKDVQSDLNTSVKSGINPTYKQSEYDGFASSLKVAFTGCGTDMGTVASVFSKMKNKTDVLALISTYGVRSVDECMWGTFKGTLNEIMAYKSTGVFFNMVPMINTMFTQRGIDYQF